MYCVGKNLNEKTQSTRTEIRFEQSGCTTNECIVEVGQLIGVDKMIGGSVSKVGNTFSVSSRIVSVGTASILHTTTYDFRGEIDELLTSGMKKVAIDLIK